MAINTDMRRVLGLVWLERLWQDVQYGCRMLAGRPGFTSVAAIRLGARPSNAETGS
jgi:hypothetical protein